MDEEASGGSGSFESFFAESLPRFLHLARLLTGDAGRAEDLAQETFWRVHRAWDGLRDPAAAPAYARTVMIRLATRWRGRRWNGERPETSERLDALGGGSDDVRMAAVDELDLVDRALAALPMEQRAVLVLRSFDNRSETEIAQLLRCSPGTVKSRASRGLAALRAAGLSVEEPGAGSASGEASDAPVAAPSVSAVTASEAKSQHSGGQDDA